MCALTHSTFIHTCPLLIHSASLLLLQRSFIASTPTHSSTPLGLAPPTAGLGRHKSIMEEIQDTNVSWAAVWDVWPVVDNTYPGSTYVQDHLYVCV